MNQGRPYKYENLEEFNTKVKEYFEMCDEKGKPYTVTGLCLYLDVCRDTLIEYEKREGFIDTIKKAKTRVENYVEENSLIGNLNATVSIFNLKNNFGWKDNRDIAISDTRKIEIVDDLPSDEDEDK